MQFTFVTFQSGILNLGYHASIEQHLLLSMSDYEHEKIVLHFDPYTSPPAVTSDHLSQALWTFFNLQFLVEIFQTPVRNAFDPVPSS